MHALSFRERKEVKRIVASAVGNPENKYLDIAEVAALAPSITGAAGVFNQIAQGDDYNARTGRAVRLKALAIRGIVANNVNNTSPVTFRLIIGIDTLSSGAVPTAANLLSATAGGNPGVLSHRNVTTTRDRYKILWDKTWVLSPATVVASIPAGTIQMNAVVGSQVTFKKRFKLHSLQEYAGTGSADYRQNALFYFAISNAANPNEPTINIQGRTVYEDI